MPTSLTGLCMAARAVLTTDEEHQADGQQDHDDDDDPEHFHPTRRAGIGRPVSRVLLLSSRVVAEEYVHYSSSLSRQFVSVKT